MIGLLIGSSLAATADQWRSRTIYQVLTDRFNRQGGGNCNNLGFYCGGNYRAMIDRLDYIQGMGFDAIWISPIVDNYDGGYHGYWGRDLYRLNNNFGSEEDFRAFVQACHSRGIWVMVDVVGNHMGNTNQDYSQNNPFNSRDHYHDYCIISDQDFNTLNQNRIQNCRLAGLADIKQENSWVRGKLLDWIRELVQKYQIDGLRIDTVPEVPKDFWREFTQSSKVYTVGEVFNGNMDYLAGYVGNVDGVLNYPFYFWMKDTFFNNKDMTNVRLFYSEWRRRLDDYKLSLLANFADNHDNARTLSREATGNQDYNIKKALYRAQIVLSLTSIGIPIVYYGSEQYFGGGNDPNNREIMWNNFDTNSDLYKMIQAVNRARKTYNTYTEPMVERYADSDIFAFTRGKMFVAVTNKHYLQVVRNITYHPYAEGTKLCNVFYNTDCVVVKSGAFTVYLNNAQPKVLVPV